MQDLNQDYQSKYLSRARRAAAWLKLYPAILLVGISGSLSQNKATQKSDIDLFIVCRADRIFSCRFFSKLILFPWARRNHDRNPAGKICLNYFLSEKSLDFKPHNQKVIGYHKNSIILFSRGEILSKLIDENSWLKPTFNLTFHQKYHDYNWKNPLAKLWEGFVKNYQVKRIESDPLTKKHPDQIVCNDLELRFHPPK